MGSNNFCVIMSGGIGSRFWPASRETKPKQFLDFFGTGKSLLRVTFERFAKAIPVENIFIATGEAYKEMTLQELPELKESQLLLEPIRRNTAPCIAYAAYRINSINPNANIVVAPSDHLILNESLFLEKVNEGFDFVESHQTLLTLGIKPNRPDTGYGYIQMSDEKLGDINKVKSFTEKPNLELAKVFLESGEFLWNSGIFIWNVKAILKAIQQYLPDLYTVLEKDLSVYNTSKEQEFINQEYFYCPNISIDYGIMEKADNVYVSAVDFGWSDLGTWGSLYDISSKDGSGNVSVNDNVQYHDSSENIISLPKDKLAVVQGLDGYIVVESDNVLLICKKSEEQKIKEFVTEVKNNFGEKFI